MLMSTAMNTTPVIAIIDPEQPIRWYRQGEFLYHGNSDGDATVAAVDHCLAGVVGSETFLGGTCSNNDKTVIACRDGASMMRQQQQQHDGFIQLSIKLLTAVAIIDPDQPIKRYRKGEFTRSNNRHPRRSPYEIDAHDEEDELHQHDEFIQLSIKLLNEGFSPTMPMTVPTVSDSYAYSSYAAGGGGGRLLREKEEDELGGSSHSSRSRKARRGSTGSSRRRSSASGSSPVRSLTALHRTFNLHRSNSFVAAPSTSSSSSKRESTSSPSPPPSMIMPTRKGSYNSYIQPRTTSTSPKRSTSTSPYRRSKSVKGFATGILRTSHPSKRASFHQYITASSSFGGGGDGTTSGGNATFHELLSDEEEAVGTKSNRVVAMDEESGGDDDDASLDEVVKKYYQQQRLEKQHRHTLYGRRASYDGVDRGLDHSY